MVRGPDRQVTRANVHEAMQTEGRPREAWTAKTLAEHLPCSPDTIYNRLRELETQEKIRTKKVGARARIWWIPDTDSTIELTSVATGVGNRVDRAILGLMAARVDVNEPWTTNELANEISDESADTLYHHMRDLEDEGLVTSMKVGSRAKVWHLGERAIR